MPTRASTDQAVDVFVARFDGGASRFIRVEDAPWAAALEARLPGPLPPSFRSLLHRYAFPAFDLGPVHLFASTGEAGLQEELGTRLFADRTLAEVTLSRGLVQVGVPARGWYDPVCFDLGRRRSGGECPLVQLDHEALLQHGRVQVVAALADTFLELLGHASSRRS